MARPVYWPTNDSYVLSVGGYPNAGIGVHVYATQTGGSAITDLQFVNASGTPTGAISGGVLISDSNGLLPAFAGPDGGPTTLWGDHGLSGERLALTSDPSGGGGGGGPTGAQALAPTSAKTSAYTATPGDYVPVDTTGGAVTITLPTAPADKTRIGVKHVVQGGSNAVTVALGGADVLNKTGGSTSATLTLLNQSTTFQYKAAGAIWYVTEADLPLSGLAATFGPAIGSDAWLIAEVGGNLAAMLTGALTRNPSGALTGASVIWRDGGTGVYAGTASTLFPSKIDSFTVTRVGSPTKTVTQPAYTRDASSAAITVRPTMTVS